MKKIRCVILCKNREVKNIQVRSEKNFFKFRGGIYNVDRKAVNLTVSSKGPNPSPELIFFEDNPNPVNSESDPVEMLDKQIIENALVISSGPKSFALEIIGDYLKSPSKLIILIFVFVIFIAVVQGLIA